MAPVHANGPSGWELLVLSVAKGTHHDQLRKSPGNGESRSCERLLTMSTRQCGLLTDESSHRSGTKAQQPDDNTAHDHDHKQGDPAQDDGDDGLNPL